MSEKSLGDIDSYQKLLEDAALAWQDKFDEEWAKLATDEDIAAFETARSIRLPEDFKLYLKTVNGMPDELFGDFRRQPC